MIKDDKRCIFDSGEYDYNNVPVKLLWGSPIPEPGTVEDIRPYILSQAQAEAWDRVLKKFDEYLVDHFFYCNTGRYRYIHSADEIRKMFEDYMEWVLYEKDGKLHAYADYEVILDSGEGVVETDYFTLTGHPMED